MGIGHLRLGVNIDHVATLRQARQARYPDPLYAAFVAADAGADGITMHLREDRRHIQDRDVERVRDHVDVTINLEMAVTSEMLDIALAVRPDDCCLVPEKRTELTTEGGLDVVGGIADIQAACERLGAAGIQVSLFIDPDDAQIDAAVRCGAAAVELHTGAYANAPDTAAGAVELARLDHGVAYARSRGLIANAGHGLDYHNVGPVAAMTGLHELNIGHAIVARAVIAGLGDAVREMKQLMNHARLSACAVRRGN